MDTLEKLKALLKFWGLKLSKEYTGLIREMREQVKKEKMIGDNEINFLIGHQSKRSR
jgi:hypothetical protein